MTGIRPSPASTVVVLRDESRDLPEATFEVLLLRRHENTAFMAGAHVFPGGRVEASDRLLHAEAWCDGVERATSGLADLTPDEAIQYRVAAIRELFEEAGILLARDHAGRVLSMLDPAIARRVGTHRKAIHAGARDLSSVCEEEQVRFSLDSLVPFAHWVTPEIDVRRFDTRFFLAMMPGEQMPVHDEIETTDSVWITPASALDRCRAGELILPPPTWSTLVDLARFRSIEAVLDWAHERTIVRIQPEFVKQDGQSMLLLPGDPLCPPISGWDPPEETRFVLENGRWNARRPPI